MRRIVTGALLGLSLTLAAGSLTACKGGGSSAPKVAKVKAGSMPSGASWDGVYYSPLFGYLHVVEEGSRIKGKWMRPVKGRWGELTGKLQGNLAKFEWTEYEDGLVGPNSKKQGKGYFVYSRPAGENVDDRIDGELGHGEDEVGTAWDAIKQRNVDPDLDSIGGSGSSEVGGGDWDSSNSESGSPEGPSEPDGDDDDDDDDGPEL
jgi:hypothetical protein